MSTVTHQQNMNDTSTKRKRVEIEKINELEPPSKKIKLSESEETQKQLSFFKYQAANVNVEKTAFELNNIPKHWNKSIKNDKIHIEEGIDWWAQQQFLRNKFHIAANTQNTKSIFYEHSYLFMDNNDNIAIISDYYNKDWSQRIKNKFAKSEVILEIYDNPSNNPNGRAIPHNVRQHILDFGDHQIKIHRSYVVIVRIPYSNFIKKYNDSFDEFLIEQKIIFYNVWSANNHKNIKRFGIIDALKEFLDFYVSECYPSNIIDCSCNKYDHLFSIYCTRQRFVSPFLILFELFDKPWIKQEKINECIEWLWKQKRNEFENFEESIPSVITQYLYPTPIFISFDEFIKEKFKSMDEEEIEEYEYPIIFGQYTEIYELESFQKNRKFVANPFKFNFLNDVEMRRVKNKIVRYLTKHRNALLTKQKVSDLWQTLSYYYFSWKLVFEQLKSITL